MARRSGIRASDAEREQVADRLRQAAAEGRLLAEELEARLARALRARTHGELYPLVADLPSGRLPRRSRPGLGSPATVAAVAVVGVVALAVIAIAALFIASLFAAWAVWWLVAWWIFHRGRVHGRRGRHPCGSLHVMSRRGLP